MLRDLEGFREWIYEKEKGLERRKTKKETNIAKHRQEGGIKTDEVRIQ